MDGRAFNNERRSEDTCTFNVGSRETGPVIKVRIWRPKFDPPHVSPFCDLSEDAQVVMKAILEESERKKQFILSHAVPQQNDSVSYYSSVYRGSFNTDIPNTGMMPPSRWQKTATQSTSAPEIPTLLGDISSQQDPQDVGTKADQITHASNGLMSQPNARLSPSSDDFSLSPLDLSGEGQAVFADCASNVSPLDVDRQEMLGVWTPPITNHSVDQSIEFCQNEPVLCLMKNHPFMNEKIDNDQWSLNEPVGPELSPPECGQLLDIVSGDNDSIKMLSKEEMKRKVDRIQSHEEEITDGDKPIQNEITKDIIITSITGICPAKQPRLHSCDLASTQDSDLDLIENMLSVSQDYDKMTKSKRKFKTPFKPSAATSKQISATVKIQSCGLRSESWIPTRKLISWMPNSGCFNQPIQRGPFHFRKLMWMIQMNIHDQHVPPTCSRGIFTSNTDKFCFDDDIQMKSLNIVNIGFISKEDRKAVGNGLLQSEEAIITLVFKDGSTLFSSNDDKKKPRESKAVGVAIGHYHIAPKTEQATRKETENQTLACLYIPTGGIKEKTDLYQWARDFTRELMSSKVRKVSFLAKEVVLFLLHTFDFEFSVVLSWIILDAKVASWLLDPDNPVQNFEGLLHTTSRNTEDKDSTLGTLMSNFKHLGSTMLQLFHKLKARNLWPLFFELETPLIPLLAKMEKSHMKVDADMFLKFSDVLKSKLSRLEKKAHNLAGHWFCINSHPQLRQVIFEELRLDLISKMKKKVSMTSVNHVKSTSEAVLTQLSEGHPLPAVVLEYRQLQKLKSTYVDGLISCVEKGYLHTHWDQTAAATGRLTSYQPNLQSVPKQPVIITDYKTSYIVGKDEDSTLPVFARDPIISVEGASFLAADFQQIELRLLAHLSDDPKLISIFTGAKTEDIFLELTSQWLDKPLGDVTQAEREQTKRVVYSVMYGADKFPAVNFFTKKCTDFCRSNGYTCTVFKRRRLIPNITSKSPKLKAQAERQAVNFCVQGSAADICKAAMLQVERALLFRPHLKARLLLQIHDELLYEVPDDNLEEFSDLVKGVMESADQLCGKMIKLKVPLSVSLSVGKKWGHLQIMNKPTNTTLLPGTCF
ncbi:DNA polymerase nu-like isoform X2 [Liolophura sinensis]|uniref:DNA polymerase nu-like isoform X2 n=1 Tax=Liolophura sinensis TaxID=3198878 RepID=UPI0031584AD6